MASHVGRRCGDWRIRLPVAPRLYGCHGRTRTTAVVVEPRLPECRRLGDWLPWFAVGQIPERTEVFLLSRFPERHGWFAAGAGIAGATSAVSAKFGGSAAIPARAGH